MNQPGYDPRAPGLLSFHDAVAGFSDGSDTPVRYLERCLERIAERELAIKAFVWSNLDAAMGAAEAATKRIRAGAPASAIDGLPIAIKDTFETRDGPAGWGSVHLQEAPGQRDAAIVTALRRAGAAIIGKTALPELGFGPPAATTNPWDHTRTPGGSSSGSAAAVGAAMVPAAIGSQGKGSLTRPASFCGVYGFKPGHGTIHRGGDGGSQATNTHVGVLAGSLADAWIIARVLSDTAGPHPGGFGIDGPITPPAPVKPKGLIRMEGPGWQRTDEAAKKVYEALLEAITRSGVPVTCAADDAHWAAIEGEMEAAAEALSAIADYESRWPLIMYLERDRDEGTGAFDPLTHERGLARLQVTRAEYEDALRYRLAARARLATAAREGVFFISPAAAGAAPKGLNTTGSAVYQWASSLAGNPVISLPLMAVDDLPLGLQVQGFVGGEASLIGAAGWLDAAFHAGDI
jgi:Asp-tRNA(Asn)/Glu-tRNA(Gln) amidotransferase A subunit family amidase